MRKIRNVSADFKNKKVSVELKNGNANAELKKIEREVLLCGAPNSGKTTLFNGLTGKSERVGNWYGVTTCVKSGVYEHNNAKITVCDLPGSYLDDYTGEAKTAADYVAKHAPNAVVVVLCEAACLEKGIELYKKTAAVSKNVALVINMYAELKKLGGCINLPLLKQKLGNNVIIAEVNEKNGIAAVKNLISGLIFNAEKHVINNVVKTENDFSEVKTENTANAIAEKVLFLPKLKLCSLDKAVLFSPFLFALCFFVVFLACAYIAFGEYGIGKTLSVLIEKIVTAAVQSPVKRALLSIRAGEFFTNFVCDGVIGSVCALLAFLPPVVIMQAAVFIAEQSGILARMAFLYDEFFARFGLSGRVIFTFLTGYGCTAAAVFCADGLQSDRLKKTAVMALPFIPCSAKTPLFLYILCAISGKYAFLCTAGFYVLGMLLAVAFAFINKKITCARGSELIIELPPLRVPNAKSLLKSLQKFAKTFIIKVGLTVFTVSLCFWFAGSVTPEFKPAKSVNQSLLCAVGKKISFLFAPIGLNDWRFSLAAIAGLFAKEGVVSALISCGGVLPNFASALAFLVFCTLYSPCFAALSAIRKAAGLKYAFHAFFCQNVIAYAVSLLLYAGLRGVKRFFSAIILFFLFIAVILLIIAIATSVNSKKSIKNGRVKSKNKNKTLKNGRFK